MSVQNEYGLTPKQEAFAQAFVEGGIASDAYRKVYNADGMNDSTIHKEAHLLVKHPAVSKRIAMIREEVKDNFEVSREMIAKKMTDIMKTTDDPRIAIKAGEALSKLMGLNEPDKLKIDGGGFNINIIKPEE